MGIVLTADNVAVFVGAAVAIVVGSLVGWWLARWDSHDR